MRLFGAFWPNALEDTIVGKPATTAPFRNSRRVFMLLLPFAHRPENSSEEKTGHFYFALTGKTGTCSPTLNGIGFDKALTFILSLWFIKPLGEDSTPGTVKPLRVSLVEPVAYPLSYSACL